MIESAVLAVQWAWHDFDPARAVFLFGLYVLIDLLNAYYTLSVARLREFRAANTDFLLYLFIAFGVISYTRNFLYILPMALGGWTGTYLTVRWQRMHRIRIKPHHIRKKRVK